MRWTERVWIDGIEVELSGGSEITRLSESQTI